MTNTEKVSTERQTNAELVEQLRRLVDDQEGGDALVLVQRQLFNRVVGRLAETLASPLHKEGEDDEALYAWLYPYVCDDGQTRILISEMRKRFAAPVPVPVTITDEMVERLYFGIEAHIKSHIASKPFEHQLTNRLRSVIRAALSLKPGEQ